MPAEYAHALARSLKGVTDAKTIGKRVDALIATLEKEDKRKALPAIARELGRIAARERSHQSVLFVARESDGKQALKEARAQLPKDAADVNVQVDESLTGGWRYVDNDTLIDTSYKAALLQLYRSLTA